MKIDASGDKTLDKTNHVSDCSMYVCNCEWECRWRKRIENLHMRRNSNNSRKRILLQKKTKNLIKTGWSRYLVLEWLVILLPRMFLSHFTSGFVVLDAEKPSPHTSFYHKLRVALSNKTLFYFNVIGKFTSVQSIQIMYAIKTIYYFLYNLYQGSKNAC